MSRKRYERHLPKCCVILVCLSALLLEACGPLAEFLPEPIAKVFPESMPEVMRVRSGTDPRNQDDFVRFRATYYLRVEDTCRKANICKTNTEEQCKSHMSTPHNNSALYRFRMTGKARTLTTKVKFESGVLRKAEIDPFGSPVINEPRDRPQLVPREGIDSVPTNRIKSLLNLMEDFKKAGLDDSTLKNIIQEELQKSVKLAPSCPDGTKGYREFWVIGPEGMKKIDEDERLVMAMTTSAEPLISGLKAATNALRSLHPLNDFSKLLDQEYLATLHAIRELDSIEENPENTLKITSAEIQKVINAFNLDVPY